jgi:gliding motility-associated-like protein
MKRILAAVVCCILYHFAAKAQLVVNEVSQGSSGNKEYIELVVAGTRTCADSCMDLRNWIVDDNGGWYGTSAISTGCYRFTNVSNWSCVPYGSIIVLYNSGDKNDNITQPDDPDDTNPHDGVYIVPINSSYIELNSASPNSSMGSSFSYPNTGFGPSTSWTPMALNNSGDAVVTVSPTALNIAASAMTYGNISGGAHISTSGGQKVYYATGSQYNSSAGWTYGSVPSSETPGAANNAANLAWINGMKQIGPGGSLTVTVYDTICQGSSYTFAGHTYNIAGTYMDTAVSVHGCDSFTTLHLAVRPKPAPPAITTPVVYCQSAVATALTAAGQNILWYTAAAGGTGTATAPVPNTNAAGTTVFYVAQTVNGCESNRDSITVTIKPTPLAPGVNTPVQYCTHETAVALTAAGQNLLWYTAATGGTGIPVAPVPATDVAGTTRFYVSQSPNGCESPRAMIEVIVNETIAGFTTNKDSLCASDTLQCMNTSTGINITSFWDFGDGSTSTAGNPSHIYAQAGTYVVRLIVNSTTGCKDSIAKTIKVLPLPAFNFTIADSILCQGAAVQIQSTFSPGYLYADWDFGDGVTLSRADVSQHAYEYPGQYTIGVKARYSVCPEKAVVRNIAVLTYPKVDIGPDTSMCPGSAPVMLTDVYFNAANQYRWSTGETGAAIAVEHPGTYWLTANNGKCSTTDTVQVFKSCYIDIPNAFTPNGDGLNDYFFPRQLLSRQLTAFHMQVLNRWGQLIFETNTTDGRGWDGRFNDVAQPAGVYVYLIEATFANDTHEQYQGNVTLFR